MKKVKSEEWKNCLQAVENDVKNLSIKFVQTVIYENKLIIRVKNMFIWHSFRNHRPNKFVKKYFEYVSDKVCCTEVRVISVR